MSHTSASLASLLLVIACGAATEPTSDGGGGGAGAGGAGAGGRNAAGTSHAGSASGGVGTAGRSGFGGSAAGSGGSFGGLGGAAGAGGTHDPRCPAYLPAGACFVPGASCDYNYFTGCLCERSDNAFAICTQVDPTCMGAGGGLAGPPPDLGRGGISSKVALPPQRRCVCTSAIPAAGGSGAGLPAPSSLWTCTQ